ncbi:Putative mitochondrial carnitine O-acetyltransferase, partial [Termitomyces sp. J132]
PIANSTFAQQHKLPKLPIPELEDTCQRYLRALEGLQDEQEHLKTKEVVRDFLENDGPKIQGKLRTWAAQKNSYIEDFWYESYLSHTDPVVLALNPFFVLENDPTPDRGSQLPRAATLIVSSLGFVHDLRAGLLQADTVRGTPLDMDQYKRLFGTSRIPTDVGCVMDTNENANHIVVLRRGQFYWFQVLDDENRPVLTEREVLRNLQAIVADADQMNKSEIARGAVGVLSTENRKIWSKLRSKLASDRHNASCLEIIDDALFVVCLDDVAPVNLADMCSNFLCGTYALENGEQVGTCINRWYDKSDNCADGSSKSRFSSTSPPPLINGHRIDTTPKKLEWKMSPELRVGVRFAETRISALICQNECEALEFRGYGKNFITSHGFSPDAFVQMAFQAAYFGLYGRTECTYEPAMTKSFLHGRTEAIRTVQPESVNFTKTFYDSEATASQKVTALRNACDRHVKLTRECSQGYGQDRHLYALYCLLQRQLAGNLDPSPDDPAPKPITSQMPKMFTDPGWETLGTSILSTSNCGNPALRLFGFGPVAADGYGIGYIIKEDMLSICASSKHLQTRRFLDTLQAYLLDIQRLLIQLHLSANERPAPFVDHLGVLRDSKTGRPINGNTVEADEDTEEYTMPGYSFFDSGDLEIWGQRKKERSDVGKVIALAEY